MGYLGDSTPRHAFEHSGLPQTTKSDFALQWRKGFFEEIHARYERREQHDEDIDITHRRVLDQLLLHSDSFTEEQKQRAVNAWHSMRAWPDVSQALKRLRTKYEIFVLANGTTSLQLDLMRSSGLHFDMMFSSQLLGLTKPDPNFYVRAMELVGGISLEPEQCVMVAAHAYDLRAAKELGMKTIYVWRLTEDVGIGEDMERVRAENDGFADGRNGTEECGVALVADMLGV